MPRDHFPWTVEQWDAARAAMARGDPGPKLIFPIIISDASPITSKAKLEEITGPVTAEVEWAHRGSFMKDTEDANAEKIKYCIVKAKQWNFLHKSLEAHQVLLWINGVKRYGYFVPTPGSGDDADSLVIGSVNG
ncbi:hypothetical protein EMCG_06537 [[Emmonsia] crescens]|uniref:Uncharacterized protein n=1 Tax=[Emmonsia] crescens TaxID=73230 RepID=A0A0G2JBN1_9EURO|nr:hypothetical protein EMCG_06537 [Emmonsia crescens UAMH 3008]